MSTRVEVPAGAARTVALSGLFSDLVLSTLTDDLAPPGNGAARVRVIAAAGAAPLVDAAVDDGSRLSAGLRFSTVGDWTSVGAGPRVVRLSGGGADTTVPLDLAAGTVVSLLVLDGPDGGLVVRPVLDAAAPATVPAGAVEAGGGPSPALLPALLLMTVPALLRGRRTRLLAVVVTCGAALLPVGPAASAQADDVVLAPVAAEAPAAVAAEAPAPVRVRVPAAGIDAAVTRTGLGADRDLAVPTDPAVAGWYAGGPAPGDVGPAVLAGHVDWSGRPGALADLAELSPGDEIVVDRADGTSVRFVVDRVARVPKGAFPTDAVYGPVPGAELRLITCGGRFDASTRSYTENVVVFAR